MSITCSRIYLRLLVPLNSVLRRMTGPERWKRALSLNQKYSRKKLVSQQCFAYLHPAIVFLFKSPRQFRGQLDQSLFFTDPVFITTSGEWRRWCTYLVYDHNVTLDCPESSLCFDHRLQNFLPYSNFTPLLKNQPGKKTE